MLGFVCGCGPCDDDADHLTSKESAKKRIASLCGVPANDPSLDWVDEMLRQADGPTLRGKIYAFKYSGGVAITHQADVMSCLPCNVRDCSGAEIQLNNEISQELVSGMKSKNVIYNTSGL
ncbi:hypothetical protein [Pseudochryseolinea flava]|nr:hypothetical protein [Pseudochryseolinea flava]